MKKLNVGLVTLATAIAASFTAVDDAVAQSGNLEQFPDEYKIVGNANKDTLIVKVLYEDRKSVV